MNNPIRLTIALLLMTVTTACFSNPETPAGHEGYVFESPRIFGNGGFQGTITGPGNFGVSIWVNKVINVDFRSRTWQEEFGILAQDDLNMKFRFQAVWSVKPGTISEVVEQYGGEEWYPRFVREPFRSFVRTEVQKYKSGDIKASRGKIAEAVRVALQAHIEGTPFVLEKVAVGNIDYPEVVTRAVETRLAEAQRLEQKATELKIARQDADIRVAEAEGIARAQEIINKTLTANYLQHEAIAAQRAMAGSVNHTTVYIPSGANGIPLVKTIQ